MTSERAVRAHLQENTACLIQNSAGFIQMAIAFCITANDVPRSHDVEQCFSLDVVVFCFLYITDF
jgi:hypothetical protein